MTTGQSERRALPPQTPPATAGHLWGPRRVELGLSLRDLARLSGVAAPLLSLLEQGRGIPTPDEYARIVEALEQAAAKEAGPLRPAKEVGA